MHTYINIYYNIYIYILVHIRNIYFRLLNFCRPQAAKIQSFDFYFQARTIIVNIYKTSLPSPNRSRTELTPKFLDQSTPSSAPRLFHTLAIVEMHWKSCETCTLQSICEINENGPRMSFLTPETCFADARCSR